MKNVLNHEYFWAAVLIFLGIGFSIFLSYFPTFWIDESMVVNLSYESNTKIISELLINEAHPPVYYFLIKTIRIIFGDKELYFRLISSLFFGLTCLYVFLLGREIGGKRMGLISSVLCASNYFLLFYSKQARPYAMLAFLSAASLYYFYRLLILKNFERKNLSLYLVFTIIGLYTNYWFILILFAQLIILIITDRKNKKVWAAIIGAGLAFLPWAIFYLFNFKNYGVAEWIDKPGFGIVWESFGYFGWGQWWFIVPMVICGITYGFIKYNLHFNEIKWLIYYFFIVIGLAFLISQFIPIYTAGRREIVLVPVFIIIVSYLFSRIENKWWQVCVSVIMLLFTYHTISDFNASVNAWESSDISLMQEVKTQIQKDDYLILYGLTNSNVNYYTRKLQINNGKIYFPFVMESNRDSLGPILQIESDKEKLDEYLSDLKNTLSKIDRGRFFVFLTNDNISDSVISFLDQNLTREKEIVPEQPHMPTWIDRVIIYKKTY